MCNTRGWSPGYKGLAPRVLGVVPRVLGVSPQGTRGGPQGKGGPTPVSKQMCRSQAVDPREVTLLTPMHWIGEVKEIYTFLEAWMPTPPC